MHTYSETLRAIAPHLAQHTYGPEMLRTLADWEREEDRYDDPIGWQTAEATYYIASLWYAGQTCPLYATLCATEFRPGPCWRKPEEWGARMVAADLHRILRESRSRR